MSTTTDLDGVGDCAGGGSTAQTCSKPGSASADGDAGPDVVNSGSNSDAVGAAPTQRVSLGGLPDVAAALIASIVVVLAFGRVVLDSNRGIDLTDEGMYLWSADPPHPTDLFHAPFGRYTGILYRLVGWDIARFRAIGVVLLVAAAALLGRTCVVAAGRWRRTAPTLASQVVGAAAVAAGATTGYTLYLLTPNYNWINLLGLLLAAAGGIEMAVPPSQRRRFATWAWPACTAIGAFLSTTGKPSSGPVILGLTAALILTVLPGSARERLLPVIRIAISTAAVWMFHFVFVNGPSDTADMFGRGLDALRILDPASYEISNALRSVRNAVVDLPGEVVRGTGGVVLAALATLLLLIRRWRAGLDDIASVSVVVLAGCCGALALKGIWIGSSSGYIVLATVGTSILLCALPLVVTARLIEGREEDERARTNDGEVPAEAPTPAGAGQLPPWWAPLASATYLSLFAAAYAFGSGNGFWFQLNGGMALLFASTVLVVFVYVDLPSRRPVAGVLAVLMALGGANVLSTAREAPYRTAAMDAQTVARSVGPHGSRLLLDPDTAAYLDQLRDITYRNGFASGTPMLDFTYYSATALYDLDALVPHSLIPTVGAYGATNDLARWSIGQLETDLWRDAWLLTAPDNPAAPDPRIVDLLGRVFPDDYELVGELTWWQRGELQQVWRPVRG